MRGEDATTLDTPTVKGGSPPHARGRRHPGRPRGAQPGITPACAGKTRTTGFTCENLSGSPPHARGRRQDGLVHDVLERITPACAGKTGSSAGPWPKVRDHPRMRGEDALPKSVSKVLRGSPPHARGRRPLLAAQPGLLRITPACAGKTRAFDVVRTLNPDHPRMRGEDHELRGLAQNGDGSPPHARGRPPPGGRRLDLLRITPACAGKTWIPLHADYFIRDHPRMRGEDQEFAHPGRLAFGSPPHARGRLLQPVELSASARITPACAGKTWIPLHADYFIRDHPRMRGEDQEFAHPGRLAFGSPPHARGRLLQPVELSASARITPACAGKTRRAGPSSTGYRDHPRMRGEDVTVLVAASVTAGSPPHARGRPASPGDSRRLFSGSPPHARGRLALRLHDR